MKKLLAILSAFVLTGSLFATTMKAQVATTLNTGDAYGLWTFDKDSHKFELAFNGDFGMTFNDFMGFNVMYAYRKGSDENFFRPAFTLGTKLGNKGWRISMLTGPTFTVTNDDTQYGVDLMGYLTYDVSKSCFLRMGTGLSLNWYKDRRDDWQWEAEILMPQLGVGFTF